jgi:hypothetical protein
MEDNIHLTQEEDSNKEVKSEFKYFPFFNNKQPVFVLFLVGIIFYCTSLYNEYALDDGIIIHQNDYVLKGARGIKDILSSDVYESFYRRMNAEDQLQGGRYRPLSVVSFALEQELIGTYRTGKYLQVEDLNKNGKLDNEEVEYIVESSEKASTNIVVNKNKSPFDDTDRKRTNYEYNNFEDLNGDGVAQQEECFNCWDLNRNFQNDASEDLNKDGVFNEIDCQVKGAFLRHFNNVWLYVLSCIFLYILFRNYFFKDNQDLAFLAALIFLTHPIHSEVVANVKSRDDIFSLLFISLTFIYAFKFVETKKVRTLILCAIMSFLALLSKEFGLLVLILLPIAFFVFNKEKIEWKGFLIPLVGFSVIGFLMIWMAIEKTYGGLPSIIVYMSGLLLYVLMIFMAYRKEMQQKNLNTVMICLQAITLLYLAMRLQSVNMSPGVPDTEILNNPYLLANAQEAFATKVVVLMKYITLLILPHPLISDYSFDTFKYSNFADASFILSSILQLVLLFVGIRLTLKRHVLGFAIMCYFVFMFLVTNFIFPIGATMGERLLFHSSIGFAIILAWFVLKWLDGLDGWQFKTKRTVLLSVITVVIVLYGCKTWERNWDWKNDVTLFLKDVKNAPNSVLVLGNAGARWIDLADTKEITGKTLPGQDSTVFNDYNGQLKITNEELTVSGFKNKREAALNKGIGYLKHAIELHPRYVNGYLNLGLAQFKLGNDKDAIFYWQNAKYLYPDNPYLNYYYSVYSGILKSRAVEASKKGDYEEAILQLCYLTIIKPNEAEAWYLFGKAHQQNKNPNRAKLCFEKALLINPEYREAKREKAVADSIK